jgi:hypothetical protein
MDISEITILSGTAAYEIANYVVMTRRLFPRKKKDISSAPIVRRLTAEDKYACENGLPLPNRAKPRTQVKANPRTLIPGNSC